MPVFQYELRIVFGDMPAGINHFVHGGAQSREPHLIYDTFKDKAAFLKELLSLHLGHDLRIVLDYVFLEHRDHQSWSLWTI